ncbi:hypothetical protein ACTT21_001447, partial [Yersinia enterocolitica]
VPDGSSRAISGADALLFYLSSPYNIESSRFVSSLIVANFYSRLFGHADVSKRSAGFHIVGFFYRILILTRILPL